MNPWAYKWMIRIETELGFLIAPTLSFGTHFNQIRFLKYSGIQTSPGSCFDFANAFRSIMRIEQNEMAILEGKQTKGTAGIRGLINRRSWPNGQ